MMYPIQNDNTWNKTKRSIPKGLCYLDIVSCKFSVMYAITMHALHASISNDDAHF